MQFWRGALTLAKAIPVVQRQAVHQYSLILLTRGKTTGYKFKDLYDVLGISYHSTQDEIKEAYRKRTKELHPDTATDKVDDRYTLEDVQTAYKTLGDEKSRHKYDKYWHEFKGENFEYRPPRPTLMERHGLLYGWNALEYIVTFVVLSAIGNLIQKGVMRIHHYSRMIDDYDPERHAKAIQDRVPILQDMEARRIEREKIYEELQKMREAAGIKTPIDFRYYKKKFNIGQGHHHVESKPLFNFSKR